MGMRMRPTEYPHIFWNEDKGLPCIEGTRLRVQDVVAHHLGGASIQEITAMFPPHTPAEVCAALAYYYDHREEMDRLIDAHHRMAEEALAEIEARQGPSPLREKLRAMGQRL
jgi:uncharacterized protein (DUF433 family)